MLPGSRAFVFTIYLLLGISFIAETAVLAYEFRDSGWFTIATHDSHLFLFFPILGTVALAAFYVPSCVFVDMYWRYVRLGRFRIAIGLVAVAALSYAVAHGLLSSRDRSIWEIAPPVLQKDRAEPAGCGGRDRPCERLALLDALANVREVSQSRLALKDFVRDCGRDPLLETARDRIERKRFCFSSTPMSVEPRLTGDSDCCKSQERFLAAVNALAKPDQRSLTGKYHAILLPFKIFFLLILFAISLLLAARNRSVKANYAALMPRIELGVLVGAIAMIFFPLMSQAFVLTTDALYGTRQIGGFKPIVPFLSFCFGAWGLLILLFFYHQRDMQVEMLGKLGGVLASAVAVIKYDLLISVVGRLIGAGASAWSVGALAIGAVAAVIVLLLPLWRQFQSETSLPSVEDESPV